MLVVTGDVRVVIAGRGAADAKMHNELVLQLPQISPWRYAEVCY